MRRTGARGERRPGSTVSRATPAQKETDIMPSYSRNSRKPLRALSLAVAAALLTGSAAHAADPPSKFVLTAYTNATGGRSLVAGEYDTALDELKNPSMFSPKDSSTVANNKCVAYTMVAEFETAMTACSEAIAHARRDLRYIGVSEIFERKEYSEYLAVAYANRAVVEWLAKDAVSAASDLASAAQLAPKADYVVQNVTALHSPHENAVAQLSVAQPAAATAER
jgi:hypothetical protein